MSDRNEQISSGDVQGYMTPLYGDGLGHKGQPRPSEGTGGGIDIVGAISDEYKVRRDAVRMFASALQSLSLSSFG